MPVRTFVDPRRQALVLQAFAARGQHEAAVAVGAFHEAGLAHLQEDPRVAERAADPVAGDPPGAHHDHLRGRKVGRQRRLGGHGLDALAGAGAFVPDETSHGRDLLRRDPRLGEGTARA